MKADSTGFHNPEFDSRYRRYAELLVARYDLVCRNASDDDVEVIEDELTNRWDALDSVQRRSLSGLGSDLNWLRRGGTLAPKAKPAQEVSNDDLRHLFQVRDRGDWHQALHQLRLYSARLAPFEVACLRATAWQALGFPEIAALFSRSAAQLEPNNARLAVPLLPVEPQRGMTGRTGAVD